MIPRVPRYNLIFLFLLLEGFLLRFHPDDEYAETDKHVKIKNGDSITEAVGMRAWLGEGRIQFLSRTRGKYESTN